MALLPLVLHGDCVVIQYLRMYECEQCLGRDEDVMFVSFKYYVYLRWPSAETTCQTSGRIFNSMRKKLTSLGSPLAITDDDISRILCLSLEVVLKDLLGASGITSLSVEGSSRIVRNHAVSSAETSSSSFLRPGSVPSSSSKSSRKIEALSTHNATAYQWSVSMTVDQPLTLRFSEWQLRLRFPPPERSS